MNIIGFHPLLLLVLVVLLVLVRYGFEKLISRFFKLISLEQTGIKLFIRAILLTLFNLLILVVFSLLNSDLFSLREPRTGMIFLVVGMAIAILVALLSFLAIRAGFGGFGYFLWHLDDLLVKRLTPLFEMSISLRTFRRSIISWDGA